MARKALGRGIMALIPEDARVGLEADIRQLALDRIKPNPFQPRLQPAENLDELVASIKEKGLLQPLLVRKRRDGYELVAGERRLRAARLAGLTAVPVVVRDVAESEMIEFALIENLHRRDLNSVEEALGYRRLADEFNFTHDQIAQRVGRSRVAITNALRILALPAAVRGHLIDGTISAGHARALLQLRTHREMEQLCERIVREGLSVRATERAAQKRTTRRGHARSDPAAAALLEKLQEVLGTRVRIVRQGAAGRLEIEFYSEADLDRIFAVITGRG